MNYTFSNSTTMTSSTIIEDYFPVIIEYANILGITDHISFNCIICTINAKCHKIKKVALCVFSLFSLIFQNPKCLINPYSPSESSGTAQLARTKPSSFIVVTPFEMYSRERLPVAVLLLASATAEGM